MVSRCMSVLGTVQVEDNWLYETTTGHREGGAMVD